ncbi:MAG: hypothetical protein R3B70_04950 [Polyangiaceae bacterium]
MAQHKASFERTADASIATLGAPPEESALDGWTDPQGAAAALGDLNDKASALLRAAADLAAGEPGFAPEPAVPLWIRLTRGSSEIRVCPALAGASSAPEPRRVTRVVVESEPMPDSETGAVARVTLSLDRKAGGSGNTLLVAEAWASTEEVAVARVRPLASRLARALSVPASLPGVEAGESAAAGASAVPALPARSLARFAMRAEGPRLVLRDFASRGPREGSGVHLLVGLVFAGCAAYAWVAFSRALGASGLTASDSLAWLGGSALLTLSAVAFLGVWQFAQRYSAASAPVVAFGGGKVVVAPWVSRKGAVGLDLEGRFGAGIDLAEVQGVSVQERKGLRAVEVATDHGPIDALITPDAALASYLAAALGRVVEDLRPESSGRTARQRARSRAGAPAQAEAR